MSTINLSDATKESLLASESGEALIFLITIDHADFDEPALVCTSPLQRIVETDDEILYGVVSRGSTFTFIPSIDVTLPTDDDESPPSIQLSIGRYGDIVDVVRSIGVEPPSVTVEMVLSTTPDVVEAYWPEFDLQETTIELDVITGTLGLDMLETEPGCPLSFTPANFPGLF